MQRYRQLLKMDCQMNFQYVVRNLEIFIHSDLHHVVYILNTSRLPVWSLFFTFGIFSMRKRRHCYVIIWFLYIWNLVMKYMELVLPPHIRCRKLKKSQNSWYRSNFVRREFYSISHKLKKIFWQDIVQRRQINFAGQSISRLTTIVV